MDKRQQTKKNKNNLKSGEVNTRIISMKESSVSNSSENFKVAKSRKSCQMGKKQEGKFLTDTGVTTAREIKLVLNIVTSSNFCLCLSCTQELTVIL